MAKYKCRIQGDFKQVYQHIKNSILSSSMSASLEDEEYISNKDFSIGIMVFERYSYSGGNRLSLNVTIIQSQEDIQIIGISSGGSNGVFFKFNTWGEDSFLEKLEEAVHKLK